MLREVCPVVYCIIIVYCITNVYLSLLFTIVQLTLIYFKIVTLEAILLFCHIGRILLEI